MRLFECKKIIVIVGPTASGKSDLALRFAKLAQGKLFKKRGINGAEIISADSRQVYRGMDIGTGKIPRDKHKGHLCDTKVPFVFSGIKHHLIDVVSPKKQFTAGDFKKLGQKAIKEILAKNKIPIIVGGTGFYIDVLLDRMPIAEVPPNKKLRARFDKLTVEHLFKMLRKLDPERAKTIDPKNKRRLIRALEIAVTTGKPVPKPNDESGIMNYDISWIGLRPKNLETRIKKRLDARLKQGMIKEVENLHGQEISWKRLDDLGLEYRWISRYLKDRRQSTIDYRHFVKSEFYEILLREIVKYSKRQMTWFTRPNFVERNLGGSKRTKEIKWFKKISEANQEVKKLFKI